jgi:hypothetical protein
MADEYEPATEADAAAAVEQALRSGADLDKIANMAGAYVDQGVEPEEAIASAASWYDHTGEDELEALQTIAEREGWS